MRVMALDYGEARTGVAISDVLGITAQGLESIDSNNKFKLLNRIAEIIKEYGIEKIVIGYPLNMNATIGPRAQKTDNFIKELETRFHLEVIKIDERLTTVASHRAMTELGISKDKKKKIVDTMSAIYILQIYLDKK